ncbi:hypothetical protein [Mycoplasmopsis edwardii]|uniref:Uncharacterized protein n=1 Tax=Mycoplasmopsis edwardii TaxID=53558 RepID=A0ACD4PI07_9BACT|nr:hypothetical protein [Mycoplasmopsis edwardii]WBP84309.1 hypothetical protein Me_995_000289 [Mycoplasmopsis edwardii]
MILSNEKFLNLKEKHNIWTEKNLLDTLIFNAINNENKDVINELKFKLQETLNNSKNSFESDVLKYFLDHTWLTKIDDSQWYLNQNIKKVTYQSGNAIFVIFVINKDITKDIKNDIYNTFVEYTNIYPTSKIIPVIWFYNDFGNENKQVAEEIKQEIYNEHKLKIKYTDTKNIFISVFINKFAQDEKDNYFAQIKDYYQDVFKNIQNIENDELFKNLISKLKNFENKLDFEEFVKGTYKELNDKYLSDNYEIIFNYIKQIF